MAALSNFLENKLIDILFRGGSYAVPSTVYIALCTTMPTAANTGATISEPGGNYSRKGVPTTTAAWYSTQTDTTASSTGTTGATGNVSAITWTTVSWTGTITSVAILDSVTLGAGNMLWFSNFTPTKTVSSGDTLQFAVNALQPTLT
jgi:hypothetical protein